MSITSKSESHEITLPALRAALASATPPVLLEALPPRYYEDGHLPGARNLPHDQVRALAPVVAPDRGAPVVVYCANPACRNSHVAANVLRDLGYADVRVFPGGKAAWEEAGLPFDRPAAAAAG